MKASIWIGLRSLFYFLLLFAQLGWFGEAAAQLPIPLSSQFDITGFLQEAILDPTCPSDTHCGGSLRLNGHTVVVPKETVVILPANALTWQELFALAPAPYTGLATGMAMADMPTPLTTYEFHVIGNRVLGAGGSDQYIAGLIYLSQQGLNAGAGFINFMDYSNGEMRVGGIINDPNCTQGGANANCSGTRVRINDPLNLSGSQATVPGGRFGRAMLSDPRFTVDPDNPTIIAGTGFPMCFPRWDPLVSDDPDCPQGNRLGGTMVQMRDPNDSSVPPGTTPDPKRQAPFQVGDYISFAGTLMSDSGNPTSGPYPGSAGTYIAAHTITANVAIFTWPGTNPAYVMTEVTLLGTGGLTVLGAGEAVIRTRFEGMTTDPTRGIELYGVDVDAAGNITDRPYGTIMPDPGAPVGAVKGRWRFRPACLPFGSVPTKPDKECVMNAAGTFLPPPREVRAVIAGTHGTPTLAANGILAGQYHAPIGEYIFPENIPGTPIVENNFNTIPFLAKGGYTSAGGTLVGQLNPWPSNVTPAPACSPPLASAGGPYTVAAGGSVTLAGSATGSTPMTFAWTAPPGSLSNAAIANPVFSDVGTGSPVALSLSATNACGTSSASTQVTVNVPAAPTVNPVAPVTLQAQANGVINLSALNPNNQQLTFTVTQAGLPALVGLTVTSTGKSSARVNFSAPALPFGQLTPSTVTLTITAIGTSGPASAPGTAVVTINPVPDQITLTTEYRIGKERLVITAVSTVPGTTLTLQPYLTDDPSGTVYFDPVALGNTFALVGGIPTLTLVGAPHPACNLNASRFSTPCAKAPLKVKSNIGGDSGFQALQKIRN